MKCIKVIETFYKYIEYLLTKGLRVEYMTYNDWINSIKIMRDYGLLPADAIHVAVALRVKVNAMASFNEGFRVVKEIKVVP